MIGFRVVVLVALVLIALGAGIFILFSHGGPQAPLATTPPQMPPPTPPVKQVEPQTSVPKHAVLGTSVEGRAIDAYTYGNGTTRLLFVGGMHGGYEWNSVLLAYAFMDYLDA